MQSKDEVELKRIVTIHKLEGTGLKILEVKASPHAFTSEITPARDGQRYTIRLH